MPSRLKKKYISLSASTLQVKCMQMRIEDLELSLNSIKLLVKTLWKGMKKILIHVHVLSHEFFQLNFTQMHFFYRIIDNFIQYGAFQDRIYDAPGPSYTVVIEETVDEVEKYFSENPNSTLRKAALILKISKFSLHRIVRRLFEITSI